MNKNFFKQYIILFIPLCIITSCKLTGDFVVARRNHTNGYYIETPSLVQNKKAKPNPFTKRIQPSEKEKAFIKNDTENLVASIISTPLIEMTISEKGLSETNVKDESQYTKTPVKGDTAKKNKTINTTKKISHTNAVADDKKYDVFSLLAFILVGFAFLLIPLWFVEMSQQLINLISITEIFPLLGIILGFIGLHRVKKEPKKLRGKGFALAAVIMGFAFYVFWILFFFISMLSMSNSP
jgi:hypothetical protein